MSIDWAALEDSVEQAMQEARVPGLALGILTRGELSYARGFGVTSVEAGGLPVTPETLFRIGSTTKLLTATAAILLVQEAQIELDRPVGRYIPGLTFSQPGLPPA
jgi:CubicO group peptidase (beta-lactamase class C family)